MGSPGFNYQAHSDSTMTHSTFAPICFRVCSVSSLEHVGLEPRREVALLPRGAGPLAPMPKPRLAPSPAAALSPLLRGSPPRLTEHGLQGARRRPERSGGRATPEAPSKLLGPSLHPREAARSLDHRPKDAQGQYLCWDHLCHRGCTKGGACPHSHKSVPKWSGLDYSVQLQLLRRGGLKGSTLKGSSRGFALSKQRRRPPPSKKALRPPAPLPRPRPTVGLGTGMPRGLANRFPTPLKTFGTFTPLIRKASWGTC